MKSYKLVLLLKTDTKKDAKEKLYADIKSWLGGVKSDKVDSIGEKKLSYPIKNARQGEFVVMNFESENVTDDFNKKLLIRDEILRHLLIRG